MYTTSVDIVFVVSESDVRQPDSSPVKPHSHRPAQKDRVYTVATDRTIRNVMAVYRRRKLAHLLPRFASAAAATKPRPARKKESRSSKVTDTSDKVTRGRSMSTSSDPVERQIVEQERASIMKVSTETAMNWKSFKLCSMIWCPASITWKCCSIFYKIIVIIIFIILCIFRVY